MIDRWRDDRQMESVADVDSIGSRQKSRKGRPTPETQQKLVYLEIQSQSEEKKMRGLGAYSSCGTLEKQNKAAHGLP